MTKLRLLLSILGLSIILFSCDDGGDPEPALEAQTAMIGTYQGYRTYELPKLGGGTLAYRDSFDIVITKGRDVKTLVFTETTSEFKDKAYRYEINVEKELSNGVQFTIPEQNFGGEPLQGEDYLNSTSFAGIHGLYDIKVDKTEKLNFSLRIVNGGVATNAVSYQYLFTKQ